MCFDVNNIDENMYVEVHKYYLCIKFDIVFKIYQVVLLLHLKKNFLRYFCVPSATGYKPLEHANCSEPVSIDESLIPTGKSFHSDGKDVSHFNMAATTYRPQ